MVRKTALSVGVLALGLAPASWAAVPALEGYSTPAGIIQDELDTAPASDSAPVSRTVAADPVDPVAVADPPQGDSLPFTGLDLGLMAGGATLLLLTGVGLRRITPVPS